jgi:hypothetical protein
LQTGETFRVSVGPNGEQANRDCQRPAISYDGGVIVYQTEAWDLIPGIINRGKNIFIHQRSDCFGPEFSTQPGPQTATAGQQVVFESIAGGNPPPTFQWRKDGVELFGATFRNLTIDRVGPGDVGTYDVVVTNVLGSVVSRPARLRLLAPERSDDHAEAIELRRVPP